MLRVSLVLALLVAFARGAAAQGYDPSLRRVASASKQPYPVVELVTMGVGSLIWERHGHIALCIVYEDPQQDACFNYGIADFRHPLAMTAGFFRGTHSFWVGKMDPSEMLAIYRYADRTIWAQALPLDAGQKTEVIDKLESDIQEDHRYYAYDHFWDNCTTRVRDILDHATKGALSSIPISPLPYVRWNESCLVLIPIDLAVLFLSGEKKVLYARVRVGMLALVALLLLVGVLRQPIWPELLWPLVPMATIGFWGFWKSGSETSKPSQGSDKSIKKSSR
jgi:hypothetical protein